MINVEQDKAQIHDDDMTCVSCGYALKGLPHGECPECGTYNGHIEAEQGEGRRELALSLQRWAPYLTWMWLPIIGLYSLPALVFVGVKEAFVAATAMVVVVCAGFAGGIVVGRGVAEPYRIMMWRVWIRLLWRLQLPWLLLGPCAIVLFIVSAPTLGVPLAGLSMIATLVLLLMWVVFSVAAMPMWASEWNELRETLCVPESSVPHMVHAIVAGIVVSMGLVVGFQGGMFIVIAMAAVFL
ncbi:MAG: hypothetical protein H6815_10085 [Phycisphaeraceae bacterium]|nr:hypothetical protein [Phycisphaerales bacterium]MCB9860787.1 hypothetical protein [Phycisphaeraceae bacterium]